ncbi:uncharacterized protein F5891DRAFT_1183808 [Suillus fuscotomentosus]|uniref:Uncharacterized protein n=1 Tax=Suillus fuscotomentosus TaxID=1912939 RepID=A0AAD4HRQ4_9AGAM|nr:uncharacterized protein F5891DRAFT_1183808 [Suillus fuscotomentosus]KAG1905099.1 hypothetical protein F5891DRAFT_1183808 [Suillus fuscotomentosus]
MDADVPDTSSSSIIAPPLFSAVPEIDNHSHTLEDENGDADIVAASKGKKKHKVVFSGEGEDNDFIEEEEPKLTSKKKALSKPTSAATSKSKSKAKEKRFSRKWT